MKVHHLNCGSFCARGAKALPGILPGAMVCHCLLIETQNKLILVDTGLGAKDVADPARLGLLSKVIRIEGGQDQTALKQIRKLGYSPADVSDLILTHLDSDHAGGISDFPSARVHVSEVELNAAQSAKGFLDRFRYRKCQWGEAVKWRKFNLKEGSSWNGFELAREIEGLPPEILLLGLPGHTAGHFGVAVSTEQGWLLHAGDSYYDRRSLEADSRAPIGIRLFERTSHKDRALALRTLKLLSAQKETMRIFSSHDPEEFFFASGT